MAVKILETLKLRGVCVVTDVRTVVERIGSGLNAMEPTAITLSFARHLTPSDPQTDAEAGTRWAPPCSPGGTTTANRAGRLGSSAGVLDSSRLARTARPTVHSGRLTVLGLLHGLNAVHKPTGSLAGMRRPTMRGSLICLPRQSGVKNRIPPVWQQPQPPPYQGNFTTY
jgi:hypothetical protein